MEIIVNDFKFVFQDSLYKDLILSYDKNVNNNYEMKIVRNINGYKIDEEELAIYLQKIMDYVTKGTDDYSKSVE